VVSFEDLKAMGKAKPAEAVPPSPDDYTTIMYTSGTTGGPCMVCKLVDARFLEQSLNFRGSAERGTADCARLCLRLGGLLV
jgi:acyl-coenzyme A synthetase/AMP-(fatty) acid ligase